jgi:hypothetical protein
MFDMVAEDGAVFEDAAVIDKVLPLAPVAIQP